MQPILKVVLSFYIYDNIFKVQKPATDKEMDDFGAAINEVDPTLNPKKLTKEDVTKCPEYHNILESFCLKGNIVFRYVYQLDRYHSFINATLICHL